MMNQKKKIVLAFLLMATLLTGLISAVFAENGILTPAFSILAGELSMVKSGLAAREITFSAADFENAVGISRISGITVLTLPPITQGQLMLGTVPVVKNQIISRNKLSSLRFIPAEKQTAECSFLFRAGNSLTYDITCTLYLLSEMNYAPSAALVNQTFKEITTVANIACYGVMSAVDPENDPMTYEIKEYPKKGILTVTDKNNGNYYYTPVTNYTGTDAFTYVATDKYGNTSEPTTVNINIEKNTSEIVYNDLIGHWAHYAAIRMTEDNIMYGINENGSRKFQPDERVSRLEFLVMAMKATGHRVSTSASNTGFADDSEIPQSYKGYVAAAVQLGFVNGVETEKGLCFMPAREVTRSEAAVFLNRMMKVAVPTVKPVFNDSGSIPAWAMESFMALSSIGVFNGTGNGNITPDGALNRGQTAQILCAVLRYKEAG